LKALRSLGVEAVADSLGDYDCWHIGLSLYAPAELEGVSCYSDTHRRTLQASRRPS